MNEAIDQTTMEEQLQEYSRKKAEIEMLQKIIAHKAISIVNQYCPYKTGDKVYYSLSWLLDHPGVITGIRYEGADDLAIDGKWLITVAPARKDFTLISGRSHKLLGRSKNDSIKKA